MNPRTKTFGFLMGEAKTRTRPMYQQMCEKLWKLPHSDEIRGQLPKDTLRLPRPVVRLAHYGEGITTAGEVGPDSALSPNPFTAVTT